MHIRKIFVGVNFYGSNICINACNAPQKIFFSLRNHFYSFLNTRLIKIELVDIFPHKQIEIPHKNKKT